MTPQECSSCGSELLEGSDFCARCGTPTVPRVEAETSQTGFKHQVQVNWAKIPKAAKVITLMAVIGSLMVLIVAGINASPPSPEDLRYTVDGTTSVIAWNPNDVDDEGRYPDYYRVYYHDSSGESCRVSWYGKTTGCQLLHKEVTSIRFEHHDSGDFPNYYWVTSCNETTMWPSHFGCSSITVEDFAFYIPPPPKRVKYTVEGRTLRLTWDPVEGADNYIVYSNSSGREDTVKEPRSELRGDCGRGEYWIEACNENGCSDHYLVKPEPLEVTLEACPAAPSRGGGSKGDNICEQGIIGGLLGLFTAGTICVLDALSN